MGDNRAGPWRNEPSSIDVLLDLWFARRKSASDITMEMSRKYPGYRFSRNSVIAKIHREVELRNKAAGRMVYDFAAGGSQRPGRPGSGACKLQRALKRALLLSPTPLRFEISHGAQVVDLPAEPVPTARKSILEIGSGHCRWPCGDPGKPDFAFCGSDALVGFPYCAGHCRIAYQLPVARARGPRDARQALRSSASAI